MRARGPAWLLGSSAALLVAGGAALAVGAVRLDVGALWTALITGPDDSTAGVVVWSLRLPRLCMGALVGASLSVAGAAMQGLFRNPLADPYVLGVSAGAALGASVALLLGAHGLVEAVGVVPLCAFVGAAGATWAVYRLAWLDGALPLTGVLLAGVAVGLTLTAGVSLTLLLAERHAGDIVLWLMGHLGGSGWAEVRWVALTTLLGVGVVGAFAGDLNALLTGEEAAAGLGVEVDRVKPWLLGASALLVAGAVSFCGAIGFVGLVVPHIARLLVGPDHRWLLPVSAALGAALLVGADTAARVALEAREVPVGVVTGALGGPFFLFLLRRRLGRAGR